MKRVMQTHEIAPYVATETVDGIACSGSLYFSRYINNRLLSQLLKVKK